MAMPPATETAEGKADANRDSGNRQHLKQTVQQIRRQPPKGAGHPVLEGDVLGRDDLDARVELRIAPKVKLQTGGHAIDYSRRRGRFREFGAARSAALLAFHRRSQDFRGWLPRMMRGSTVLPSSSVLRTSLPEMNTGFSSLCFSIRSTRPADS